MTFDEEPKKPKSLDEQGQTSSLDDMLPHEKKQHYLDILRSLIGGVKAGGITTTEQVKSSLDKLGKAYGPFGSHSDEIDQLINELKTQCRRKHIEFPGWYSAEPTADS